MSYTIALSPLAPANPVTLPPSLLNNMNDDGPSIIGCGCAIGAAAPEATAELRIAPQVTASVRYSLQGTRVVGAVVVRAGGWSHTMPFSVDATPIVKRIALAHANYHAARNPATFGKFSFKSFVRTITSPVRAVVQAAQSAVKQATAIAAPMVPKAARNFLSKVVAKGKLAIKTAKATWDKAAGLVAKIAKEKAVQFARTIVKSPITAGIVTGIALAFPAVGAPALAGLAAANMAFAALDKASAAVAMVKAAEAQLNNLLPQKSNPAVAAKIATIQADIKKAQPELKKLVAAAAPARAEIAKVTAAARKGDRMAKLSLSTLASTKRANVQLRNRIVSAVIASRNARTPAERAAAEAVALRRYLPSAQLALAKYHPRMQQLLRTAAPVIAAAQKKAAASSAKKPAPAPAKKPAATGVRAPNPASLALRTAQAAQLAAAKQKAQQVSTLKLASAMAAARR
jgi:hypothetical protein